ncbi:MULTISPECIES: putative DNA modification/repair radical SAM protein [Capnocytophaga]|uniref:putative DNA modification/repair radical SAM protein n=1 Tax=Capnocytophaga TaxID=1016 RepID=UPI00020C5DD6|nr:MULTISPECIES: putative DNA modification/repair radical SAM protein [unclassified Capnocytophaga]KHE69853.1 putative DNA modification/repair radical SAM protein [Capnocytophaga sp. oral taxon 329 str. F0087]QGS16919.1 putative DNA modification/repair radical SAM protein [Capnocytophaga sp. FDAARGOS_737]
MNFERIKEKLAILADAAKYDVSCSSSGSNRKGVKGDLGNTSAFGICHSFTEDGRCISLLKILLTNHCIYDCVYCVSRRSNDIKRAAFTVEEIVDLTINFYRRNYIEGLFLSSGVFKDPNTTMERLVRVAKKLRLEERFNGYIHLKTIPGASDELIREAGLYADRLSINLEIPTKEGLKLLAPEKDHKQMLSNVEFVKNELAISTIEKQKYKHAPKFAPAGQTTQMIIGATNETDQKIIHVADYMYQKLALKRVYYSGYVPVLQDSRLPSLQSQVPVVRENRLYQADWLMRYYGFAPNEIVDERQPFLDLEIDPKLAWALRNSHLFPIDINQAPREMLLRIPGVGVRSVQKILMARKFQTLSYYDLKKMGVTLSRAKYFITCSGATPLAGTIDPLRLRGLLLSQSHSKHKQLFTGQLSLF